MRFFSSLKSTSEARSRRPTSRVMRQDEHSEANLKRAARRRLVGAFILVCAMVIVLPQILKTVPQGAESELDILMSNPQSIGMDTTASAKRTTTRLPYERLISPGEEVISPNPKTPSDSAPKSSNSNVESGREVRKVDNPANSGDGALSGVSSNKIFLQAGVFASEERALRWFNKLKMAKLPAQMERKKTAEGDRYYLRVGPFAERAAAEAAQKKVQSIGLPSIISESH